MPTLECWIELPTGEKIGPITADQQPHNDPDGEAGRSTILGSVACLLRDFMQQYWVNLLAVGLFVCAAVRYCRLNDAFDINRHLEWIALAFGGLVMFIASEEFSEWSGRYGVSRQHWLMTLAWYIRLLGGTVLVYFTIALFRV